MPAKKKYDTEEERIAAQKESYKRYNNSEKGKAAAERFKQKRKTDPDIRKKYSDKSKAWYDKQTPEKIAEIRNRRDQKVKDNRKKDPRKLLIYDAKKRAKKKGLEFCLKEQDIIIPEFCPVLGLKLEVGSGSRQNSSPSLDRFDNNKGYTKENVRVICLRANQLKNDSSLDEMRLLLKYMEGYL